MDIDVLKSKARAIEPIVRVGKSGLTDQVLGEIEKHLKIRKLIKIRILKSVLEQTDKKTLGLIITDYTKSEIISFVGNMLVIYKR